MNGIKNKYMAVCVPGAEEILKDEISELISEKNTLSFERGKVFFHSELKLEDLSSIRCADNIYKILSKFKIGSHKDDLKQFYKNLLKVDYYDFFHNDKTKIVISASRSGKHTYSRYDLSDIAADALLSTNYFVMGDNQDHDIAFRIDAKDENCLFSLQLTSSEFRFRGNHFNTAKGSIRPTIAHCLIRLSNPKNDDVFYDPFCGAGTIPFERLGYKHKKIFASDINYEIVQMAKLNLGSNIIVFESDATNTKIKSNSIDTVVTNMPWGKQIYVENLEKLYYDFIKELKRILKVNGKAVILTNQEEWIQNACERYNIVVTHLARLSLHGLHPSAFLLRCPK